MWRFWRFGDRDVRERDLDRELRDHLTLEAEERGGDLSAARRALGSTALIKEDTRDEWGGMALERLWQDLRFAGRSMRRRPAFAGSAVLILALGIGINTAAFTLVRAVVLNPLPFPNPDQLVMIRKEWKDGAGPSRFTGVAPGDFLDLQQRVRSASEIAAYYSRELTVTGAREPYRVAAAAVSGNFFRLFGVEPVLGRDRIREAGPATPPVAMLSHALWTQRFGGQPNVIGSDIILNSVSYTVVAVMGPDFVFPQIQGAGPHFDLWTSLPHDAAWRAQRGPNYVTMFARLAPEASLDTARAEMAVISQEFAREQPDFFGGKALIVAPLGDQVIGSTSALLYLLWAAAACILLIACANLSNMLLTRAAARQKELALRASLGASRWRLVRQLLTESVVLGACGGALGVCLAWLLITSVPAFAFTGVPRLHEVRMELPVLASSLAITLVTVLLFGTVPAWRMSRTRPAFLQQSPRATAGLGTSALRSGLVVLQISFALMLLVGAGLLVRSFVTVLAADTGFDEQNVLSFDLSLPRDSYQSGDAPAYFERLRERIAALPKVRDVGAVNFLPLAGAQFSWTYLLEGRPQPENVPAAEFRIITAGFLSGLDIRLAAGRDFDRRDTASAMPVGIVNEAFARLNWPGENPIGKRLRLQGQYPWMTVVGVVRDVRFRRIDEAAAPTMYVPLSQMPERSMTMVVRTQGEPWELAAPVRDLVRAEDSRVLLLNLQPLTRVVDLALRERRLVMTLLGLFAGLALFLSSFGIYSLVSHGVMQRTAEIGVRIALGAEAGDIRRLVLRQVLLLTGGGIAAGLAGAFALSTLIASLLYGIEPTDPATVAAVCGVLVAAAALASYLPARRAARLDPMVALRAD